MESGVRGSVIWSATIGKQLVRIRDRGPFLLPLSGLGTRLGAETKIQSLVPAAGTV